VRNDSVQPSWSPDGTRIAFSENSQIRLMNPDGTGVIDLGQAGSNPDWQPIPINSYPRPRGASPTRVSLVPAYRQCSSPNSTHGAPLAFPSCGPPALASDHLTLGTPDANGKRTTMEGYVELKAMTSDVALHARVNNVFNANLTDYSGTLLVNFPLRITDRNNTPNPGGPGAATTQPFPFAFEAACTPTADATIGSDCGVSTTANALMPGAVAANLRAVWQVGQVRIYDGGPDNDGSTEAGNTVFAAQGVFVP
jgi:hypothetical protein